MEPRALTPEEAALWSGGNASPATMADRLGIPLNHVMIALRALKEMGRLPKHYEEYIR